MSLEVVLDGFSVQLKGRNAIYGGVLMISDVSTECGDCCKYQHRLAVRRARKSCL